MQSQCGCKLVNLVTVVDFAFAFSYQLQESSKDQAGWQSKEMYEGSKYTI